ICGGRTMRNLTGKLAVLLLTAGALAMPAYAAPPAKVGGGAPRAAGGGGAHIGGGGGGGAHIGGGGAHFGGGGAAHFGGGGGARSIGRIGGGGARSVGRIGGGGGGGRAFTSHAARSFSPHVSGRSANFATVHRGTSINRSVLRTQRLTHGKTVNGNLRTRTLANSNALTRAQTRALRSNASNANASAQTRIQQRALRRNAITTGSITPLAARNGRFASRFALANGANVRGANFAAHRAWRHGWRARFVGWYGPVFWPYAYSDIFDYAFWPGGYDDGYWDYAYDDFFDGMFWGQYGPPEDYAYAGPAAPRSGRVNYAAVQELCQQPGTGITAWPFADIEKK